MVMGPTSTSEVDPALTPRTALSVSLRKASINLLHHKNPLHRNATLTCIQESPPNDSPSRPLQVSVFQNDGRVFSPQLEDCRGEGIGRRRENSPAGPRALR